MAIKEKKRHRCPHERDLWICSKPIKTSHYYEPHRQSVYSHKQARLGQVSSDCRDCSCSNEDQLELATLRGLVAGSVRLLPSGTHVIRGSHCSEDEARCSNLVRGTAGPGLRQIAAGSPQRLSFSPQRGQTAAGYNSAEEGENGIFLSPWGNLLLSQWMSLLTSGQIKLFTSFSFVSFFFFWFVFVKLFLLRSRLQWPWPGWDRKGGEMKQVIWWRWGEVRCW